MPCKNKTGDLVIERCGRYQYGRWAGEGFENMVNSRGGNIERTLPEVLCLNPSEYRAKKEQESIEDTSCQMDRKRRVSSRNLRSIHVPGTKSMVYGLCGLDQG